MKKKLGRYFKPSSDLKPDCFQFLTECLNCCNLGFYFNASNRTAEGLAAEIPAELMITWIDQCGVCLARIAVPMIHQAEQEMSDVFSSGHIACVHLDPFKDFKHCADI